MEARITILLLIIILVGMVLAVGTMTDDNDAINHGSTGERLIVATMPGVADDISLLLEGCNVSVVSLIQPGVDPHTYNLQPSQIDLLGRAQLVVSTGHTPLEERIEEYVGQDRLFVITEVDGVDIITVNGAPNLHGVQYDPGNLEAILRGLAQRIQALYPDCSSTVEANLAALLGELEGLVEEYAGVLEGRRLVVSDPAGVYAVQWLGGDILLLSQGHEVPVPPGVLEEARRWLGEGAIAVVVVEDGAPVTRAGEWLESEAMAAGAPILRVPAPYSPGPTLEKLYSIVGELDKTVGYG